MLLRLDQITVDLEIQARASMSLEVVAEYAAAYRRTVNWHTIPVVFQDGDTYWLADGFHRRDAAEEAGLVEIEVTVLEGTRRDAILHAVAANSSHGLRRTPGDKRRAVEMLLRDEEWRQWTDREIARRCSVSPNFVGGVRSDLSVLGGQIGNQTDPSVLGGQIAEPTAPQTPPTRIVHRGGTTYAMATGAINGAARRREPTVPPPAPEPVAVAGPPPPHGCPVDANGVEIPPRLRDQFATQLFVEAGKTLRDLANHLRSAASWNRYLLIAPLMEELESARLAVTASQPWVIHAHCAGAGCEECRHCGWVPEWRYQEMQERGDW